MASIESANTENVVVNRDGDTIIYSNASHVDEKSNFEKKVEDFSLDSFVADTTKKAKETIDDTKGVIKTVWNGLLRDLTMPTGSDLVGLKYGGDIVKVENASILDDDNTRNKQFGGNQMVFEESDFYVLFTNEKVIDVILEYFPKGNLEQVFDYFEVITNTGCGYVAMINALFIEYEGKEEEFYKTFGFNMYSVDKYGNINYNYEGLVVEWFTYYWVECKGMDMEEIIEKADGSSKDTENHFDDYLRDKYGIESTVDHVYVSDTNQEKVEELISDDKAIILSAYNYDLYKVNSKTGEKGELYISEGGAHAMTFVGYTDNGDIIVSSWGEKYIVDLDEKENNYFTIVDIDN